MYTLQDLQSLVPHLSKIELKKVHTYMDTYEKQSLCKKLLLLLQKGNVNSIEKFRNKQAAKPFLRLTHHLFNIILEVVSFDSNIKNKEIYFTSSPLLVLRKNSIYTQVLAIKSQVDLLVRKYEENINIAKEYDFVDELLSNQYELLNIYCVLGKKEKLVSLQQDIIHYEKQRTLQKELFLLYNIFTFKGGNTPEDKSTLKYVQSYLPQLHSYINNNSSPRIKWFAFRILTEYYSSSFDSVKSYSICRKYVDYLNTNIKYYGPNHLSIAYKMMAKASIQLYKFDEALLYLKNSSQFNRQNHHNLELVLQNEFVIRFYQGKYKEAKETLLSFTNRKNPYYIACCDFFISSEFHLDYDGTKEIEKDRDGWNIYIRLVQTMHLIQSGKFDLAGSHIERLRKYIERIPNKESVNPRFKAILKIMRELNKYNFDFKITQQKNQSLVEKISSSAMDEYTWRILSPELIRFDVWFESKVRRLPYQTMFNERVEAKRQELKNIQLEQID